MLGRLKRPESYIGHGVFVFIEGSYLPVKRKITGVTIEYQNVFGEHKWDVREVTVEHSGKLKPHDVFMTLKMAMSFTGRKIEENGLSAKLERLKERHRKASCMVCAYKKKEEGER